MDGCRTLLKNLELRDSARSGPLPRWDSQAKPDRRMRKVALIPYFSSFDAYSDESRVIRQRDSLGLDDSVILEHVTCIDVKLHTDEHS